MGRKLPAIRFGHPAIFSDDPPMFHGLPPIRRERSAIFFHLPTIRHEGRIIPQRHSGGAARPSVINFVCGTAGRDARRHIKQCCHARFDFGFRVENYGASFQVSTSSETPCRGRGKFKSSFPSFTRRFFCGSSSASCPAFSSSRVLLGRQRQRRTHFQPRLRRNCCGRRQCGIASAVAAPLANGRLVQRQVHRPRPGRAGRRRDNARRARRVCFCRGWPARRRRDCRARCGARIVSASRPALLCTASALAAHLGEHPENVQHRQVKPVAGERAEAGERRLVFKFKRPRQRALEIHAVLVREIQRARKTRGGVAGIHRAVAIGRPAGRCRRRSLRDRIRR